MSTAEKVAMMDVDVPFANGLWESLPEELGYKIATLAMLGSEVGSAREFRLLNRAFAEAFWPLALCTLPITHPRHSEFLVRGVVSIACMSVLNGVRVGSDMYTHCYTTVYNGCTQKPPHNLSWCYYEWLSASSATLHTALGDQRVTEDQQRKILMLIRAVFSYLDRFYVKRLSVGTLSVLLTKAINVRNAALEFPPLPLLPERAFASPPSRDQTAAEATDEAEGGDAADATVTGHFTALAAAAIAGGGLAGMESAVMQWAAQQEAQHAA